jgi:predicted RNA binding protein YcfA (HicA-like mRNA interferase family)
MTVKELERILIEDGWILKNQKGSHRQYIHPFKPGKVTIPWHKGDVDIGTARSIMKQAGLKKGL